MRFLFYVLFGVMLTTQAMAAQIGKACFKEQCVDIKIMTEPQEMAKGLSGTESLGANEGMLFIFPEEDIYTFWMKDMKFAIDILWLNDEGQVMDLVESVPACKAEPCEVYKPKANSVFVLEVPAGYAKAKGIAVGSTVTLDY